MGIAQPDIARTHRARAPRQEPGLRLRRAGVSAVAAGLMLVVAMPGGSFDVVVRNQIGLALWFALGLGLALGLFPLTRQSRLALLPTAALGALALLAAIGLSWSDSAERTEVEIARLAFLAGIPLLWLALLDRKTWRAAAAGLMLGAVAVCALALASRLWPDAFPTDYSAQSFTHRLSYPLEYWNALGSWAAVTMAMGLAWSAHARSTAVRAAALATTPIAGLVIYLTFSRGAILALVTGAVAVIALGRNRWLSLLHALVAAMATAGGIAVVRGYPQLAEGPGGEGVGATLGILAAGMLGCAIVALASRRLGGSRWRLSAGPARAALAVGGVAVLVLALAAGPGLVSRTWDELQSTAPATQDAGLEARLGSVGSSARVDAWEAALETFSGHPVRGAGFGTYEFSWNRQALAQGPIQDAHSLYLDTLAEGGLIGLSLLAVALAGLLVLALQRHLRQRDPAWTGASAALLGAYIAFLVHAGIDWLWESTAVAVLAISCASIVIASGGRPRGAPPRPLVRIGGSVLALAAMAVMLPSLVSTLAIRDSQEAVRVRDVPTASLRATEAVEARPWAASPYVQRALVSELVGDLRAAELDLRRAAEREPANWKHRLLLARVYAQEGRVRRAVRAARRARELRPTAVPFSVVR